MSKIKAFTLTELLISMVLVGIITGIVYSAFHIVQTYVMKYKNEKERVSYLLTSLRLLENDCFYSESILMENSTCRLLRDTAEVQYIFSDKEIIRIQNPLMDTFAYQKVEFSPMYLNKHSGLINKINVRIFLEKDTLTFMYKKDYTPEELLKNKTSKNGRS